MRMMYYSVMTQTNSEKEIPSAPIRSRIQDLLDLPITSSDAPALTRLRLMLGEFGFSFFRVWLCLLKDVSMTDVCNYRLRIDWKILINSTRLIRSTGIDLLIDFFR